jgi:hypothetical protein
MVAGRFERELEGLPRQERYVELFTRLVARLRAQSRRDGVIVGPTFIQRTVVPAVTVRCAGVNVSDCPTKISSGPGVSVSDDPQAARTTASRNGNDCDRSLMKPPGDGEGTESRPGLFHRRLGEAAAREVRDSVAPRRTE